MKVRRIVTALLLAFAPLVVSAQSAIAGVGLYGTTPTAMLNGGAGYGATAYAPASMTLYGYNPSGLTPKLATYTSGITATGSAAQTCTLTFTGGTTQAVGTVKLSTTNTVATGSVVTFSTVGTGYIAPPVTATASNGIATCSGTVVVATALGAYAPFAVDASGNLVISGGGSGTVNSGTAGQIAHYGSTGTAVSGTNALDNGTTATTQSAGDNSTKVATTAYVAAPGAIAPTSVTASGTVSAPTMVLNGNDLGTTLAGKASSSASTTVNGTPCTLGGSCTPSAVTLSTSGTSGPATLVGGVLNVPQYAGAVFRSYYVDAVLGLDSNDGLTIATAFQTISKLLTADALAPATNWYFVRSTSGNTTPRVWRLTSQLVIPRSNMTIAAAGSGPADTTTTPPLLDGTAIISSGSWSLYSGGCYQTTITHDIVDSNGWVNAYENGIVLQRVASAAACGTTANSMFVSSDSASSATLYVNPLGSTNPTTDGQLYEYTAVSIPLTGMTVTNITFDGLWTRGNWDQSGSTQLSDNSLVRNGLFTDGSKHNMIVGGSSTVEDSVGHNAYYNLPSSVFVASCQDCAGGTVEFLRDTATQDSNLPSFPGAGGFYAHSATAQDFASLIYDTDVSQGMPGGSFGGLAQNIVITNSTGDGAPGLGGLQSTTISNTTINTTASRAAAGNTPILRIAHSTLITSDGFGDGAYGVYWTPSGAGTLSITDSTIGSGYIPLIVSGTVTSFTNLRNTFIAGSGGYAEMIIPAPTSWTNDFNTYFNLSFIQVGGTAYQFLQTQTPNYLTSFPANDVNSLFYYWGNSRPLLYQTASIGGSSVAAGACTSGNVTLGGNWQYGNGPFSIPALTVTPAGQYPGTNVPGPYFSVSSTITIPSGGYGAPAPNQAIVWVCNNDSVNAHTPNAAVYNVQVNQTGKP